MSMANQNQSVKSVEKFLHAVNSVFGCEYRILDRLWKRFGNWRYVWEMASVSELVAAGVGEKFAGRLVERRRKFDVDAEFAMVWEKDIVIVSRQHVEYPKVLLQLPDAPYLFYRKGAPLHSHANMMAIVGTRKPSSYGEKIAYELAENLALQNVTIVSGLAFGIDAVAHFATVSIHKPTVAVLASGLYEITPSTHHRLTEKILEFGGSLISEYPPSDPAYPRRFLERNRIIAGLCETTVVIEAGERSGALVTARLANEYNRDVYAVPGDIHRPQAQGCLKLLSDGAHPLISIPKFLLDHDLQSQKALPPLTLEELQVVDAFQPEPFSTDFLAEKTMLPIQNLHMLLTQLEMKGVVRMNKNFLWESQFIPQSQ